MAETKPRAEQVRFISDKTGSHVLDEYIEQAERNGMTIGDLLDTLFDANGNIQVGLFEFRIEDQGSNDYDLQFRVGSYIDPEEGWQTISEPVFNQILAAAIAEKNAAADFAQDAEDQVVLATNQANIATAQAGISTTQAGISTTQAGISTTQATNSNNARIASEAARDIAVAAANGSNWKKSVRAATTANRTLSGLTNTNLDGVTPVNGDRILVKNQTTTSQNGIYIAASGAWSRATDMDAWSEVPSALTAVEEGTIQQDTIWICTSNSGGTIDSTSIVFAQYSGAAISTNVDKFAGNGTAGPFALSGAPGSDNNAEVSVSGVIQDPGVDYSITGTSLSFLSGSFPPSPASGVTNNIIVRYGVMQAINVPATGSVQWSTIASSTIASLSDWAAGTANKLLAAVNFLPALLAAIGFNKFYESPEQTITNGAYVSVAHSLGVLPKQRSLVLVCKTADLGYAVGEEVESLCYGTTSAALSSSGIALVTSTTNIGFQVGTTGIGIVRKDATVGNAVLINNANWRVILRAWG